MGQLNVYVPKELEKKIRKEAKQKGKSVSAFVLDALREKIEPRTWSAPFLAMLEKGGLSEDFPNDIEDLPPEERSDL